MSWIGWLVLLGMLGALVLVARGFMHVVAWLAEEYIIEPRELRRRNERLQARQRAEPIATVRPSEKAQGKPPTAVVHRPVRTSGLVRKPSRIARSLSSLIGTILKKDYDYWVGSALAEEDLAAKVVYLSKALALNPTYAPAWSIKGYALFGLQRFGEAMACFEKSLELRPSALMWYRKGLCCCQLDRFDEAIRCFDEAMKACPSEDRQLLADAAQMKRQVEACQGTITL